MGLEVNGIEKINCTQIFQKFSYKGESCSVATKGNSFHRRVFYLSHFLKNDADLNVFHV